MQINARWRQINCSPEPFIVETSKPPMQNNIYLKFEPEADGYVLFVSDFRGRIWRERLFGDNLQDRLKSEVSGLEIETGDLLKLLEQISQELTEVSCEISADSSFLILKASAKIGFIKLKWTFKTELCSTETFSSTIYIDFIFPMFSYLRTDKQLIDVVTNADFDLFYSQVIPSLIEPVKSKEPLIVPSETSFERPKVNDEEVEDMKRKELEEQLQAAKKKKKKLI